MKTALCSRPKMTSSNNDDLNETKCNFSESEPADAESAKNVDNALVNTVSEGIREQGSSQSKIPSRLGRYEIKKELGKGGMGAVYLAIDTVLHREVALKIPNFNAEEDSEQIARFYREARSMATLRHSNLCAVFDVGEQDGLHYLSMEYIDGQSLEGYLKNGKSHPCRQVAAVIRKIALAMDEAHKLGVVHRDLKPANIMINKKNEPVIMDFGLARSQNDQDTTLTRVGQVMGTPAYMSPEQVHGDQEKIGPQSDIFALGVICYEMLAGQRPFQGNLSSVMVQIVTQEPQSPAAISSQKVDSALEKICMKAMAKDQKVRFKTAGEMAKALRNYLANKAEPTQQSQNQSASKEPAAKRAPANKPQQKPVALSPLEPIATTGEMDALAGDFFAEPVKRSTLQRPALSASAKRPMGHSKWAQKKGKTKSSFNRTIAILIGSGIAGFLILLSIIIVLLPGNKGTIRIEINDPAIEVAVNESGYTIKGATKEEIKLEPGEKLLTVKRDGFEFETDKFTLKKGETVVLKVEFLSDKITVKDGKVLVGEGILPKKQKLESKIDSDLAAFGSSSPKSPDNGSSKRMPIKSANSNQPQLAKNPFSYNQAKQYQVDWAKHLGVKVEEVNTIGMAIRVIPPAEFLMGTSDKQYEELEVEAKRLKLPAFYTNLMKYEKPRHKVTITRPYGISTCEVTRGQFRKFVDATGYKTEPDKNRTGGDGYLDGQRSNGPDFLWDSNLGFDPPSTDDNPVVNISWKDATAFCDWLSKKEEVTYRLPTEAEWEFACRAGSDELYGPFDPKKLSQYARFEAGGGTTQVGRKLPNPFGLYDMLGNVWEVCNDLHLEYDAAPAIDPIGGKVGGIRITKGGSWDGFFQLNRPALRSIAATACSTGFRVVREFPRN